MGPVPPILTPSLNPPSPASLREVVVLLPCMSSLPPPNSSSAKFNCISAPSVSPTSSAIQACSMWSLICDDDGLTASPPNIPVLLTVVVLGEDSAPPPDCPAVVSSRLVRLVFACWAPGTPCPLTLSGTLSAITEATLTESSISVKAPGTVLILFFDTMRKMEQIKTFNRFRACIGHIQ